MSEDYSGGGIVYVGCCWDGLKIGFCSWILKEGDFRVFKRFFLVKIISFLWEK